MRKLIVTACAAAAMVTTAVVAPDRADAMAIGSPAGLLAATENAGAAEKVAYVCRWNGWRQVCWWRPNYGYYGGYYGGYRRHGFYRPHRWGWGRRW